MKYGISLAIIASSLLVFAAACADSPAPTAPSSSSSASQPQALSLAISRSVDWSLFAGSRRVAAAEITGAAADVPTAPSNLAFTVSGSTVVLTWSAPASGNATSYIVEAGTGAGLSNITSFDTGSSATTLTVTGVPNGTYFVRVRARNADGNSAPSNESTIVTSSGPCAAPAAPTGLTAGSSGSTVALSWTAAAGATSYIIEAGTAPGAANLASFDTGSGATSFSTSAPSGTYYLRVRARTACGTSGPSNEVVLVISGTPPTSSVTGRWVGSLTSDTDIINCPTTVSVDMNLTANGSAVTGTANTRITSVRYSSCSGVLGFVADYGVAGTVAADGSISFAFGNTGAFSFSGAIAANQMSGRYSGQNGRGTFSFTKQ